MWHGEASPVAASKLAPVFESLPTMPCIGQLESRVFTFCSNPQGAIGDFLFGYRLLDEKLRFEASGLALGQFKGRSATGAARASDGAPANTTWTRGTAL